MVSDERPNWSATDRQRGFLLVLIDQRAVPDAAAENVRQLCERDDFSKTDASALIDGFTKMPYRPKPYAAPVTVTDPDGTVHRLATIDDLIPSKFAIPITELLSTDLRQFAGNSDLLFGEVREWKGHKFINALKGAPGAFARTRLKGTDRGDVVRVLATDQYKYTKIFGDHYTCCGSCGAELTDETSRSLKLGPDCRTKFGF